MKEMLKMGLLLDNENMLYQVRMYFDERVDQMDKEVMLDYIEFYKNLGMLYYDEFISETMKQYFDRNYFSFEVDEIFRLYYLMSYDRKRDFQNNQMMIDTLKIRLTEEKERQKVTEQGIKNLIYGMQRYSVKNKKLEFILKR